MKLQIDKPQTPALRKTAVMARFSPVIMLSGLIWYFLDPDLSLIYSKIHLILIVPFALARLFYK